MATSGVTIEGIRGLINRLNFVADSIIDRRILEEIGTFLKFRITSRTQQGLDGDGVPFKPYSAAYARAREKAGYQSDFVDLTRTGSMFASLTYDVDPNVVTVYFMPGTDKKGVENPAKAFFLQQDRDFFGMSDDDIREIYDIYRSRIRRAIRRG
jgi:hypothetical protein